jgi:hypothetical protein
MGMFDYLRCEYPLPAPNAQALDYQTKDTGAQYMDTYVITAEGRLVHEKYDVEDRSDPKAEGLDALLGSMTRVNKRNSEPLDFTGEISFYTGGDYNEPTRWWIEFSAYFINGLLQSMTLVSDTRPSPHNT